MELIYKGKTKDVYKAENGNYVLKFKDDVTGENGVFDPGANTVGLSIEGVGRANLLMSKRYFEMLREKGVATHYVNIDVDKATMEVLPAKPFGKGLEVICRLRAVGSFIRRYGAYIESGTKLPYYVEMTIKDDDRGDPLITKEALVALNILSEKQYDEIAKATQDISRLIAEDLAGFGLELFDIKLEFGVTKDNKVVLMDEIASGNMRVYENGKVMEPMKLSERLVK